ncbi:MAG TPA: sugar ABC transporter permease [Candidatus Limnocylindrales bacterium]|nr:sugar ABC transporter permease [Candidatus Limnocylindrales bacterium]
MASRDRPESLEDRGPARFGSGLEVSAAARRVNLRPLQGAGSAKNAFLWPALFVILFLSIFPLIVSLYLSVSRLQFTPDGIEVRFLGLTNYQSLLFGTERAHFIGVLKPPSPLGWAVFVGAIVLVGWAFLRAVRGGAGLIGLVFRAVGGLLFIGLLWLIVQTMLSAGGRPGTLIVTFTYVFVGLTVQYLLGLGLAVLVTQHLPGQRFFRVVFLLPMMITPVGVGYMFQMLTDTGKGPFVPVFAALGLQGFTWVADPWGARIAVMIGDIWQWTPFMFIVLLAALEGQDVETTEAALVDGANRRQVFTHITLPALLPVSTTIVLIRMIEGFKIIDLPNILTNGGPGTATESLTLQAFIDWRTLNLGRSAAIAYLLLIVVTIVATAYVNLIRRRVATT